MKKRFLTTVTLLLCALLVLCACDGTPITGTPNQPSQQPQPGINSWATGDLPTNVNVVESDLSVFDLTFTPRDLNHTFMPASATTITFSTTEKPRINGRMAITEAACRRKQNQTRSPRIKTEMITLAVCFLGWIFWISSAEMTP